VIPSTPVEAIVHQDVKVFIRVTGGRIPWLTQYLAVIDTVQILQLRKKKEMDDHELAIFLAPFWKAWSSRKRLDGQPYDPGNINWLTEWALNEAIPPGGKRRKLQ
jgi:hypothetical protein